MMSLFVCALFGRIVTEKYFVCWLICFGLLIRCRCRCDTYYKHMDAKSTHGNTNLAFLFGFVCVCYFSFSLFFVIFFPNNFRVVKEDKCGIWLLFFFVRFCRLIRCASHFLYGWIEIMSQHYWCSGKCISVIYQLLAPNLNIFIDIIYSLLCAIKWSPAAGSSLHITTELFDYIDNLFIRFKSD